MSVHDIPGKQWKSWRQAMLVCIFLTMKCTPELRELARKTAEANADFDRQLSNCCHWYYGPPIR